MCVKIQHIDANQTNEHLNRRHLPYHENRDFQNVNRGMIYLNNACPILLINMAISLLLLTVLEEHSDC
jgi:hypothetical protein